MSKLASKILRLFISDVNAGACVPDHGCCCGTPGHAVSCIGTCVTQSGCITGSRCNG